MKPHHPISLCIIICLSGFLLSCQSAESPEQVSDKFWQAVQQQDIEQIKKYSLEDSYNSTTDFSLLDDLDEFSFGKIIIDGDHAEVETRVSITAEENQHRVSVQTFLFKHEGHWLVDYDSTVAPITMKKEMTELVGGIEDLTEEFTKEIEGSVEEFKEKALPEIKSQLEKAEQELKEKLPEIKQKIDEFLKDLEKSIQDSIPQPKKEESKTQKT